MSELKAYTDEELLALLLKYVGSPGEDGRSTEDAFEEVKTLSAEKPNVCWRMLEVAREASLSDWQMARLSAGAFEDLMSNHGAAFIDRVEIEARRDDKMRFLLATVWRCGMAEEVWRRIEALRDKLAIKRL